jgi:hypothetical protein
MLAEIHITISEKGEVNVTAPFENQVLCLGLLEVAKALIIEQSKKPKSPIIKPDMKIC